MDRTAVWTARFFGLEGFYGVDYRIYGKRGGGQHLELSLIHIFGILKDCFRGHIVSSVYLTGDGFDGDWMKQSVAFLCQGRRAFVGKNLYSKGACYAALCSEQQENWDYVYPVSYTHLGLSDSNNRIVENISQLSAATEEVTASAEQVREISEQNRNYAEEVKGAIGTIRGRTDEMKQFT